MTTTEEPQKLQAQLMEGARPQLNVPSAYFNGFELSGSLSDMSCVLMIDGVPVIKLNMSFTTAKTLANNLGHTVELFEQATEHSVMTMDDVKEGYEKNVPK